MKIKLKKTLFTLLLTGGIVFAGSKVLTNVDFEGAKKVFVDNSKKDDKNLIAIETSKELEPSTAPLETESEVYELEEVKPKSIDDIEKVYSLRVVNETKLLEEPTTVSDVIETVYPNDSLKPVSVVDDYFKVELENGYGYIKTCDSELKRDYKLPYESTSYGYVTSDTELFDKRDCSKEIMDVEAYEFIKVYETIDGISFVSIDDSTYGYIDSSKIGEISGTFVVVDESSQSLRFYIDNELELETSVVTGKPSTPTDIGFHTVYDISDHRYLVGPTWKSYVDYMIKFNGGEGLHDAEYHTNEDGRKHGWRSKEEFGGETYLTNGSHGCVNMMNDDVKFIYENINLGDKVLVKK